MTKENKENNEKATQKEAKAEQVDIAKAVSEAVAAAMAPLAESIGTVVTTSITEGLNKVSEQEAESKRVQGLSDTEKFEEERKQFNSKIQELETNFMKSESDRKTAELDSNISSELNRVNINPNLTAGAKHEINTLINQNPNTNITELVNTWASSDVGKSYTLSDSAQGSSVLPSRTGQMNGQSQRLRSEMSDQEKDSADGQSIARFMYNIR